MGIGDLGVERMGLRSLVFWFVEKSGFLVGVVCGLKYGEETRGWWSRWDEKVAIWRGWRGWMENMGKGSLVVEVERILVIFSG